jgi:DNA-3-methyladenine glycosylase
VAERGGRRRRLPRRFYRRDARVVAPELLNKLLVFGPLSARIIEVEAYCGAEDPGSHAFRGRTARNATMFGDGGRLYVYFTYGMHFCSNVVCGIEGEATAVLLRAAVPLEGIEDMHARRAAARSTRDLCSGPAKLCQAFDIDRRHDGADLVAADRGLWIADDGVEPPAAVGVSVRVGLRAGADLPWRFYVAGDPGLSKR